MSRQIMMPQRKQKAVSSDSGGIGLGSILGLVGAGAAAFATAGASIPVSTVLGAAGTGAALGGIVGGIADQAMATPQTYQQEQKGMMQTGGEERASSASLRRLQQQRESSVNALMQARSSLEYMPKEIKNEYEPVLTAALAKERGRYS